MPKKNPLASVSQPGELIIRVHLLINCSWLNQHLPDKCLISMVFSGVQYKKTGSISQLGRLVIREQFSQVTVYSLVKNDCIGSCYSTLKKPPAGISQLGELKIKVHLPIKCSVRMPTNPDKVVEADKAKQLSLETFNGRMHLRYQKEQEIDLKLSRFNLDLGGEQEKL